MNDLKNISLFKGRIKNTVPDRAVSLKEVYELIKSEEYRAATEELRAITDEPKQKDFKDTHFDYVTFSGTFTERANDKLIEHSHYICLDFDHLEDKDSFAKTLLADDYVSTSLLTDSVRGNGLKWVVYNSEIEGNNDNHKKCYEMLSDYIEAKYGVEADQNAKDVARACYLPHDPAAWINEKDDCGSWSFLGLKDWIKENAPQFVPGRDRRKQQKQSSLRGDAASLRGTKQSSVPSVSSVPIVPQNTQIPQILDTTHIETVIQRIEAAEIDITTLTDPYADWRNLAFAFAPLGEDGRQYFHRVSVFNSNYSEEDANRQYNACLKSDASSTIENPVTIATFFDLAKHAGIDISYPLNSLNSLNSLNHDRDLLPTIPQEIYTKLPKFLQNVTSYADSPEDADLLLLGSLVAISSALPFIYGIYYGLTVYPNLFLFVSAQAAAGKGRLTLCKRLVEPVHRDLKQQYKREREQYEEQMIEYKKSWDAQKPQEPAQRLLIIPANNSSTGVLQLLNDNHGEGLIFETEGDTLTQAFKSEHGNYSDGLRKAFQHEAITYNRRGNREYVEIENPRLSVLLSGTPGQINSLIPGSENGLFSRFMFYYKKTELVWQNVFAISQNNRLDYAFDKLGDDFFAFHKLWKNQNQQFEFILTATQQEQFNEYFAQIQKQYCQMCGDDYVGTVRRLGLITYRIAMLLTALRLMEPENSLTRGLNPLLNPLLTPLLPTLTCSDDDFYIAMDIVKVLLQHATYVYNHLPQTSPNTNVHNRDALFLQSLPQEFDKQQCLKIAKDLQIPADTANKKLKKFCDSGLLTKTAHGNYQKTGLPNCQIAKLPQYN